jgi:hypothetical protein
VFNSLFPLLVKYSHFLYWKSDSFNLLVWVKLLIENGGHHTYLGLNALIDKIYATTNKRFIKKEVWETRLKDWLNTLSYGRNCGEYYISHIYTLNKQVRGWQVRFPSTLKLNNFNRAFMSSTYGGSDKAFVLAVQYRDKIISDWIKKIYSI